MASSELRGDGGGLFANAVPDRVGTHLKGLVTVLLVFVGHNEGMRWAGRERGAQTPANGQMAMMVVGMRKQL
jgi:hypothetical protein